MKHALVKVTVECPVVGPERELSSTELEASVDEDIRRFDSYFQSLENGALNQFEYSIIKTYLHWKTHPPQEKKNG